MPKQIVLPGDIVVELTGEGCGSVHSSLQHGSSNPEWNAATHAVESLVLAHALAGLDVESSQYRQGLQAALDAIAVGLGDN